MNQIRFTTVVLATVITLFVLFSGYKLYDRYYIGNSLEGSINKIVATEEIKIAKQETPPTVYISSSEIKDLQIVYRKTAQVVHQKLGSEFRIILIDKRTEKLSRLYEKCSFIIQEGIATGGFQEMHNGVRELAGREDVCCHLTIDSSNVYLELNDNHGYLYEVIPRQSQFKEWEKPGSEIY